MTKSEWLVAHDEHGNEFVVHAVRPRFIAELHDDEDGERVENVEWLDPIDEYSPAEIARLMRVCGEALQRIDEADAKAMEEYIDDED